jgi:hypothetical protein
MIINNSMGRLWIEEFEMLFNAQSQHLLGGTEETYKGPLLSEQPVSLLILKLRAF